MLRLNKVFILNLLILQIFPLFPFQFGNGNNDSTTKFIKVADDVKDVYLGQWSSYIIKNDDSLWGAGFEIAKTFGISGDQIQKTFIRLEDDVLYYNGYFLVKKDGRTYTTDKGIHKTDYKIKKGSLGIVFIQDDNCLYADSEDFHGAYGLGKKEIHLDKPTLLMKDVIHVYSNGYYTQVVTSNYELFVSGEHYLPDPYKKSYTFFKLADNVKYSTEGFYITENNELYAFGWCGHGVSGLGKQNDVHMKPTKVMDDVSSVVCNQDVAFAITINGDLYGWGGDTPNYVGQLGFGDKKAVYIPKLVMNNVKKVALGNYHTAIIKSDDSLWMCGANNWVGGY